MQEYFDVPVTLQADSLLVVYVSIVYSATASVPAILYQKFAAYWTPPVKAKAYLRSHACVAPGFSSEPSSGRPSNFMSYFASVQRPGPAHQTTVGTGLAVSSLSMSLLWL